MSIVAADLLPPSSLVLTGGRDGLRGLLATDFIGAEWAADDSDLVKASRRRGLRALGTVDEIAMVAIPDIHIRPIAPPDFAPLPPCIPDPVHSSPRRSRRRRHRRSQAKYRQCSARRMCSVCRLIWSGTARAGATASRCLMDRSRARMAPRSVSPASAPGGSVSIRRWRRSIIPG